MIDLAQRSKPYEIALPYGLEVTDKPLAGSITRAVLRHMRPAVS